MDSADSKPKEIAGDPDVPKTEAGEMVPDGEASPGASDLSEDQALAFLQRADVTAAELALLARNPGAMKSRKVLLALATHPRTPRHITIPTLRRLFVFDLMQVALTPTVAADVKRAAEEQILNRMESVSLGERISLARRASGRVAAALLLDAEERVISTALDNSHLVEALVVTALMKHNAPDALFALASEHPKWSLRKDVQIALLRNEKTPLPRAVELARNFLAEFVEEIVPEARREALLQSLDPSTKEDFESGEQK
jgi:hypothetical protein